MSLVFGGVSTAELLEELSRRLACLDGNDKLDVTSSSVLECAYIESFTKLRNWTKTALDIYKLEFSLLAFPVFVVRFMYIVILFRHLSNHYVLYMFFFIVI